MSDNFPAYPHPESRCERPTCDHTQADHARVLGLACTVTDCDCTQLVHPDAAALLAAISQYAKDHQ